ncbi:MAG: 3-hydroxyacyl-CoA dehydrogenase family protein [Deltaproteobacteria bacterium]|nr:3-hydroxyacyl-CoA dehydrogenase family protein [Deltaproteobacteria bacterium]
MKNIGVVGAGTMGRGIAQVFALYNYPVVLVDVVDEILEAALEMIKERTAPELWDKVMGLIEVSTGLDMTRGCDLIIEAVAENIDIKKDLFKKLGGICGKDAIIATNTSALSINGLSEAVVNPSRFIGMHFMNPPKVMKLVEVIKGARTSAGTVETVIDIAKKIGKVTAVSSDSPGFISNRLLFALIGEALRVLESGVAKKEDIDTVMKYGMNHPMGPIELADFIGLDICMQIFKTLFEGLEDERYKPPGILEYLVKKGKLGRKTKEGFYKYG